MSTPKYDTQTPFLASYLLFRKDNKVAFLLRSNTNWMNGYYSLPAGKVEKEESFIQAAIREGLEETGVKISPDNLTLVHSIHRHHAGETDWVDMVFEVKNWQGELHNAEPEIHSELTWFKPEELPENTVPYVVFMIEQIQKGEPYSEYGWPN
jgi:8-oxo-dGTP diphosphatase